MTDLPLTEDEKALIRARLNQLELEHHDLDDVIGRLSADVTLDRLRLQRLKKRKLVLKDRISALEDKLLPDIIA